MGSGHVRCSALLAGKPRQHQYTCICVVQQTWRSSPTQTHVWWIDDLTDHSTAMQAKNVAETATALTGLLGAVTGFMAADASAAASGGVLSFAPAAQPSTVGRHFCLLNPLCYTLRTHAALDGNPHGCNGLRAR